MKKSEESSEVPETVFPLGGHWRVTIYKDTLEARPSRTLEVLLDVVSGKEYLRGRHFQRFGGCEEDPFIRFCITG